MNPALIAQVGKMLFTSRTMQGAAVATGTAWYELLPKAVAGDPNSIGLLVLSGLAYLRTVQGRWKASKDYRKGKGQ